MKITINLDGKATREVHNVRNSKLTEKETNTFENVVVSVEIDGVEELKALVAILGDRIGEAFGRKLSKKVGKVGKGTKLDTFKVRKPRRPSPLFPVTEEDMKMDAKRADNFEVFYTGPDGKSTMVLVDEATAAKLASHGTISGEELAKLTNPENLVTVEMPASVLAEKIRPKSTNPFVPPAEPTAEELMTEIKDSVDRLKFPGKLGPRKPESAYSSTPLDEV